MYALESLIWRARSDVTDTAISEKDGAWQEVWSKVGRVKRGVGALSDGTKTPDVGVG